MSDSGAFVPDWDDRLDGWKAIAAHFGRSVRTVQRWELTEHLPVHRHPHQKQASAWAFRSELEQWAARRQDLTEAVSELAAADVEASAPPLFATAYPVPQQSLNRPATMVGLALLIIASFFVAHHSSPVPRRTATQLGVADETNVAGAYDALARGRAAYLARRYAEALDAAATAAERDPEYAAAWILLSKTYGRMVSPRLTTAGLRSEETTARMVAASDRALTLAPSSAEALVAQALTARARGDVSGWRHYARKAIDVDPGCAEAHAVLADSYSGQLGFACGRDRNPELAEQYYRAALNFDPSLETALINRGQNLAYLGRYDECAATLKPFIDATGDSVALAVRARCFLTGNDIFSATRDVQRLLATESTPLPTVLLHRGWLRMKRGEVNDGVRDLESLAELQSDVATELSVAQVYADVGEGSRAAEHLARVFAMDPSCARVVAASLSFQEVRHAPEVTATLASYGVR